MNWNERYSAMKKHLGLKNKDVAEITGNTEYSIRTVTSRKGEKFPRMLRLAIWVFEEMKNKENTLQKNN